MLHAYCLFGKRYGNKYVISSEFKWLAHMISSTRLWTNKVDLSEDDQNDYTLSGMRPLFNFYNRAANAARHLLVAECPKQLVSESWLKNKEAPSENVVKGEVYF